MVVDYGHAWKVCRTSDALDVDLWRLIGVDAGVSDHTCERHPHEDERGCAVYLFGTPDDRLPR